GKTSTISYSQIKPNVIEAARGDPLDGGNTQNKRVVLMIPELENLNPLMTSRRILHIPDSHSTPGWIQAQIDSFFYAKQGIVNCSGDLSTFYKSTKYIKA